jgi:ABC-type glycerol-3-phosphate transport system substrate-binding protein
MTRTKISLLMFALLLLALGLAICGSYAAASADRHLLTAGQTLTHQLQLTDLALWTEARYTRHPSQADSFAAFQDHPTAFDHFPAGSIVVPTVPRSERQIQVRKKTSAQ